MSEEPFPLTPELPDWQREILAERLFEDETNPEAAEPWNEVRERLLRMHMPSGRHRKAFHESRSGISDTTSRRTETREFEWETVMTGQTTPPAPVHRW